MWLSRIISALVWVQVPMLLGYSLEETMRAMRKGIQRASADSPHIVQGTVKAVYSLSYSMPARKCVILHGLQSWMQQGAPSPFH